MGITELIEKVKQQDQNAFEQLYNQFYPAGFSLCLQFVKNEEDALDIMQDAFITVYSKLDLLEDAAKFKSWYMQIVANKCRDFLKKQNPLSFTDANAYDEEGALQFEVEETDRDFIPEAAVDYSETVRIVDEMIAELPEEQRMCILLYFANDMSIPEIAKALEVSEATVKSRIKYAKDKIRAKTEAYEKKTGTKLYSIAGLALIPFIRWALQQKAASAPQAPAGTFANIVEAIPSSTSGVTAAASSTASAASNAGNLFSAMSSAQKVVSGVLAGAIVVGASIGVGVTVAGNKEKEEIPEEPVATIQETQPAKTPLYWSNYIDVVYEGVSGQATVTVDVNYAVLDAMLGQDRIQAFLDNADISAQIPTIASLLEFTVSNTEDLANGDTIAVTVAPSALLKGADKTLEDISDHFGISFDVKFSLIVENLPECEEIDIFSMVEDFIVYDGEDGEAYAMFEFPEDYHQTVSDQVQLDFVDSEIIVTVDGEIAGIIDLSLIAPNPNKEIIDGVVVIVDENGPLSNGDMLTIELGNYNMTEILEALHPLGYTIGALQYELEVFDL